MNEQKNNKNGLVIGIDLGTTNSCVSVCRNGKFEVIANLEGGRTTPSVVAYQKGSYIVGGSAKRQMGMNPDVISSVKRLMGNREKIEIGEEKLSPEEVSAKIISDLVNSASTYLGEKVKQVVITVPAYFNQAQREATINAGRIAGVKVLRIVNEPTAAALAYGFEEEKNKKNSSQNILVYDLGGGTYDCSILSVNISNDSKGEDNESDLSYDGGIIQVKSTAGINNLGGDDYDSRIFDFISNKIKEETGKVISTDFRNSQNESEKTLYYRILEASQQAKHNLSSSVVSLISLPYLFEGQSFQYEITRAEFERITKDLTDKTISKVWDALKDADLKPSQIDKILLVGGSTRMSNISERIEREFNKKPSKSLNPDEVVAIGASVLGSILVGENSSLLLIDVVPLSLGIVTAGDINTTVVRRNTTIPTEETSIFSTASDNQTSVDITIVQGERPRAYDNATLGNFRLDGIPAEPRGVPQIEIKFSVNADSILTVSAKELRTGKNASITVKSNSLSEEQIQEMVKSAEENKAKDDEIRSNSELLNTAQGYANMFSSQEEELRKNPNFNEESEEFKRFKELSEPLVKAVEEKNYSVMRQELNRIQDILKAAEELRQSQDAKPNSEEQEQKSDSGENDDKNPDDIS